MVIIATKFRFTFPGNFPNESDRFRMVQYIKMIRVDEPREFLPVGHSTNFEKDELFPCGWQPTELGLKLFGLADW